MQDLFTAIINFCVQGNLDVGIIDRYNGTLSKRFRNRKVEIVYVTDTSKLRENSVVVTNALSSDLLNLLKSNPQVKILFYNLFPEGLKRVNMVRGYEVPFLTRKYTGLLANTLIAKNSLILMSASASKHLHICDDIDLSSLLIPLIYDDEIALDAGAHGGIVSVGRKDEWKQRLFKNFLLYLDNNSFEDRITVITDDPRGLKQFYGRVVTANLNLRIFGPVPRRELKHTISGNGRLGFGMGLSALHLVSAGLPTIVLDATYDNSVFDNYRYQFLHQKQAYELGDVVKKRDEFRGYDTKELLELYNNTDQLRDFWKSDVLSLRSQYEKNSVMNKFFIKVRSARATIADIEGNIFWR